MEDKSSIIGQRIKIRRKAVDWSQTKLADLVKVTPSSINQYEKGEKIPSTETLLTLAKVLGVTTDYLLGAEEETGIFVDKHVSVLFRDFKGLPPKDRATIQDHVAFLKGKAKVKAAKK